MRAATLDARAVRLLRLAVLLVAAGLFGLLYLVSSGFRSEVIRLWVSLGAGISWACETTSSPSGCGRRSLLAFVVLQALVAPVPSFLITFANGLAFGVFWGWMLSLFGHVLAAAVCFDLTLFRPRAGRGARGQDGPQVSRPLVRLVGYTRFVGASSQA